MSAEIHVSGLISPLAEGLDLAGGPDRVLHTAGDRPDADTLPALADPAADHRDQAVSRRRGDVEEKHARIVGFLDATGHEAVLLGRADSVAWFTSGGDLGQDLASEASSVLLYLNRNSRAVLSDNVQSARVFEEELAGLGFQLKERPWHDNPGRIVAELTHNRRVATDMGCRGAPGSGDGDLLRRLRWPLTRLERQRLRELGRTLTLAVEATCRNFDRGETEADVAGHLAHRLIREGVVPVDLRVASDDRLARYRQPTFKAAPIRKRATIAVTGRRHGLCASLTRTVSFGPVDRDFRAKHALAAMVDATCIYFSRPARPSPRSSAGRGGSTRNTTTRTNGRSTTRGSWSATRPARRRWCPTAPSPSARAWPCRWSPSVGPARSQGTVVIDERGFEVVTAPQAWPRLDVAVKGFTIVRPGILER